MSPRFYPRPTTRFDQDRHFTPTKPDYPSTKSNPSQPIRLKLSTPTPIRCRHLHLSMRRSRKRGLIREKTMYPLCPKHGTNPTLPRLTKYPLLISTRRSTLHRCPYPTNALSDPTNNKQLPSRSPTNTTNTNIPIQLYPTRLLSRSIPWRRLLFPR